jgi:hypothetical protein
MTNQLKKVRKKNDKVGTQDQILPWGMMISKSGALEKLIIVDEDENDL